MILEGQYLNLLNFLENFEKNCSAKLGLNIFIQNEEKLWNEGETKILP